MRTLLGSFSAAIPATAAIATVATQQRSPRHSPVPYLFGGLAAMLGLIAFALLILACSYWKLSGRAYQNGDRVVGEKDQEEGTDAVKVYEEKILVIMAGDENPTFLATPVFTIKASSFAAHPKEMNQNAENVKEVTGHQETQRQQEQNQ